MQYQVSMTTRMLAIAGLCVFLLCVLLFLLGIELGKRFAQPEPPPPAATTMGAPMTAPAQMPVAPAMPATPAAPAMTAPAVTAPGVTAPTVTAPAVQKH